MAKLNEMVLSAALALSGCGDTVNNYYGSESDRTWDGQEIDNECNSPLFGAHMWNIYKCIDEALHLREDCLVGVGNKNEGYNYQPNGLTVTYEGLELISSDRSAILVFDPNLRFSTVPIAGTPGRAGTTVTLQEAETHRRINGIMDQYNGHVLDTKNRQGRSGPSDGCTYAHADDCIFVPESRPYTIEECKASPYVIWP